MGPRKLKTTQHTDRDQTVTTSLRNPLASETDKRSRPLRRGEHIWIHVLGRDWVVKKPTKLGIAGTIMGSLGVGCIIWGSVKLFDPLKIGSVLFIAGVILICFKRLEEQHGRLEEKNLAADEIFNLGRERGESDAYEDGYKDGMAFGERRRPQAPHCPSCGTSTALHSVVSVANRG